MAIIDPALFQAYIAAIAKREKSQSDQRRLPLTSLAAGASKGFTDTQVKLLEAQMKEELSNKEFGQKKELAATEYDRKENLKVFDQLIEGKMGATQATHTMPGYQSPLDIIRQPSDRTSMLQSAPSAPSGAGTPPTAPASTVPSLFNHRVDSPIQTTMKDISTGATREKYSQISKGELPGVQLTPQAGPQAPDKPTAADKHTIHIGIDRVNGQMLNLRESGDPKDKDYNPFGKVMTPEQFAELENNPNTKIEKYDLSKQIDRASVRVLLFDKQKQEKLRQETIKAGGNLASINKLGDVILNLKTQLDANATSPTMVLKGKVYRLTNNNEYRAFVSEVKNVTLELMEAIKGTPSDKDMEQVLERIGVTGGKGGLLDGDILDMANLNNILTNLDSIYTLRSYDVFRGYDSLYRGDRENALEMMQEYNSDTFKAINNLTESFYTQNRMFNKAKETQEQSDTAVSAAHSRFGKYKNQK